MKLRYDIVFNIDNKKYNLTACELSAKLKKELSAKLESRAAPLEEAERLSHHVEFLRSEKEALAGLAKDGDPKQKVSAWLDLRKINKELYSAELELKEKQAAAKEITEILEEHFKSVLNEVIDGADRESFLKDLERLDVSYASVFDELKAHIEKATQKK